MSSLLRIFGISIIATIAAIATAYFYDGLIAALVVTLLIIIEATFSFDNAVINARVLRTMSPFWQRIFLTIGILIAVFGMRLVFPILIVVIAAQLNWQQVLALALHKPGEYSQLLQAAHAPIALFGGMFLLMLAIHFFTDSSRAIKWLRRPESWLQKLDSVYWRLILAAIPLASLSIALPSQADTILKSGAAGALLYTLIHHLTELMLGREANRQAAAATGGAGLMAFLYLEVLDASLSFDGVIGAFAITKDVLLIALGLGVGAFWVRSLTVYLVRHNTLANLRYLEHGAFYTILALAVFLLLSIVQPLPEIFIGLFGVAIIGASIFSSRQANHVRKA